jgi:hypothetical protein
LNNEERKEEFIKLLSKTKQQEAIDLINFIPTIDEEGRYTSSIGKI